MVVGYENGLVVLVLHHKPCSIPIWQGNGHNAFLREGDEFLCVQLGLTAQSPRSREHFNASVGTTSHDDRQRQEGSSFKTGQGESHH